MELTNIKLVFFLLSLFCLFSFFYYNRNSSIIRVYCSIIYNFTFIVNDGTIDSNDATVSIIVEEGEQTEQAQEEGEQTEQAQEEED